MLVLLVISSWASGGCLYVSMWENQNTETMMDISITNSPMLPRKLLLFPQGSANPGIVLPSPSTYFAANSEI